MKITDVSVCGFQPAIRGMRNPRNSWDKSDSVFCSDDGCDFCGYGKICTTSAHWKQPNLNFCIGDADLKLMRDLAWAGPEHRKYLRMIIVYMDITAPRYWWHEFDTYKVGTVANSCSTMHTLTSKPIELSDFEVDNADDIWGKYIRNVVVECELLRQMYNDFNDKKYWRTLIQLLPQSYLQTRTVMLNYEVCHNIYQQRQNHKLKEWTKFCRELERLPYFREIFNI